VSALLPQSAGRLVGLTRPTERFTPLAEKKPTGRAPMILEFLATLTSAKQNATSAAGEAIEVKTAAQKRKREEPVTHQAEQTNFLRRYVKKPNTNQTLVEAGIAPL
jgi:formate dehydrogenase maturation protein FdhE